MVVSSCFVSFGEVNKTKNGTMEVTRRCRIKRLFLETPRVLRRTSDTLKRRTELSQRITAKSWKYTLPRCEEPSSHMKGLIETVPLYIGPLNRPKISRH